MANEKRLIYADELRQTIESKIYWGGTGLLEAIDEAPTVDAVEVVRCKDCKHEEDGYCNHFGYYSYAPMVFENDFCSRGERRDGE